MKRFAESTLGHPYFLFGVRIVLGFVFVYAALEKIFQPEAFARDISYYRLLPNLLLNLFAIILPWIELLAGLFLLVGVLTRGSALVISSLLVLFGVAIAVSLARGLDISCGCFGTASARKVGWTTLGEDLLMLAGSVLLYYMPSTFASLESYLRKTALISDSSSPQSAL
jgi:putative oxidoreductase